jgi:hypothetical protein
MNLVPYLPKKPQITEIYIARPAAAAKKLEPQISQISQIKNNYSYFRVSEMPFKRDFTGCCLKKSWNENTFRME